MHFMFTIEFKPFVNLLSVSLLRKYVEMFASQCRKSPKLRTYHTLFPLFEEHILATKYVHCTVKSTIYCQEKTRSDPSQCLPIRIISDRYAGDKVAAELRFCKQP